MCLYSGGIGLGPQRWHWNDGIYYVCLLIFHFLRHLYERMVCDVPYRLLHKNFNFFFNARRLFADVINDVGQLLDMFSALVPASWYLTVLSLSAICKCMNMANMLLPMSSFFTLY